MLKTLNPLLPRRAGGFSALEASHQAGFFAFVIRINVKVRPTHRIPENIGNSTVFSFAAASVFGFKNAFHIKSDPALLGGLPPLVLRRSGSLHTQQGFFIHCLKNAIAFFLLGELFRIDDVL